MAGTAGVAGIAFDAGVAGLPPEAGEAGIAGLPPEAGVAGVVFFSFSFFECFLSFSFLAFAELASTAADSDAESAFLLFPFLSGAAVSRAGVSTADAAFPLFVLLAGGSAKAFTDIANKLTNNVDKILFILTP